MKYKFKPGDKLIYKPTQTPFIVIKVLDESYNTYNLTLANGLPGVPLRGNVRHIHSSEIFKTYEPMDEAIRLLFSGE